MATTLQEESQSPSTPKVAATQEVTLVDDDALAASGAYTYASIVNVRDARRMTLFINYDPASATGRLGLIPAVSNAGTEPASGDDSWYIMGSWDSTVTATALGGAVPSGADWTATPSFSALPFGQTLVLGPTVANATDEVRIAITLDVTPFRYMQLAHAEHGDTANPGTITITYTLSS